MQERWRKGHGTFAVRVRVVLPFGVADVKTSHCWNCHRGLQQSMCFGGGVTEGVLLVEEDEGLLF